jgi:hypothetical protein
VSLVRGRVAHLVRWKISDESDEDYLADCAKIWRTETLPVLVVSWVVISIVVSVLWHAYHEHGPEIACAPAVDCAVFDTASLPGPVKVQP